MNWDCNIEAFKERVKWRKMRDIRQSFPTGQGGRQRTAASPADIAVAFQSGQIKTGHLPVGSDIGKI